MKKFSFKLYIIFFAIVVVFFCAFSLAYSSITENYLEKQIGSNLSFMTEKVAVDVNIKVKRDYNTFSSFVNENIVYQTDSYGNFVLDADNNKIIDDNLTMNELAASKDELIISNAKGISFGYIEYEKEQYSDNYIAEGYNIEGSSYRYNEEDRNINFYNQDFAVYSLNEILIGSFDNTRYVFLKLGNIFVFFEAQPYLDSMLEGITGFPENEFFVIAANGQIAYQKGGIVERSKNKFFIDFLKDNNSQLSVNEVISSINEGNSSNTALDFNDEKSIIAYTPLDEDFSNSKLYLIYIFEERVVLDSMSYLTRTLAIFFGSLFVINIVALGVAIILVYQKERDIETAKIVYFIARPFLITVNQKGIIKYLNKSCKLKLKDSEHLKTVNDFTVYEKTNDILEDIHSLAGFTICEEDVTGNNIYIRFIPVKSFGGYYLFGEDVTKNILENIRNRQAALYNPVTNLPNRRVLETDLQKALVEKEFEHRKASLVNIDVIDFAKTNRIFGYVAADKMLREVSQIISESIKEFDAVLYNIRTSLFMVYFKGVTNYSEVVAWSTKLLTDLSKPISLKEDNLVTVESKMGIFNIEVDKYDDLTIDKIYSSAEKALERAKSSRHTKCAIYNAEFGQSLTRDQVMEQDLKNAIDNKEFIMFFQPQYNTKKNKIVGFEALIRWNNPKYRLSSVEHYISLAEKNGMIVQLGRFIMEESFKFAKKMQPYNIHISMNVSPVQILQSGFVSELIMMYNQFELKPGMVALEITETFLMENSDTIIDKLRLLKENGFSIHLDDFGIGYSSMLYLKDLPIDTIKIDKDFTKHVLNDKFSRAIVSKVVQLALTLNLDIIAEGVEVEKQSQFLSKNGCDVIQGYLIGKPMSEKEAIALTIKYNGTAGTKKEEKSKSKSKIISKITDEKENSYDDFETKDDSSSEDDESDN